MDLLRTMVDHHIWLLGEMVTRAAKMSGEQLDRPIELSVDDFSVERGEAVTGMRKRLDEVGPAFAAQVADICRQDRLDEMLVCPGENAVEEGRFQS
jgi:hypothetical protein